MGKLIHIKFTEECLAGSKCSVTIWLYYHCYYPILSLSKRLLPHLPHMQQSFCFIWGLGESWLLEKCNLREWIGACQLVWQQLKSLGMIVLMRLKLRAQGRVGNKVRRVGWHQTVTSAMVILKTFKSHWTPALGPISIMLPVIMAIFLPEGSPDQILRI